MDMLGFRRLAHALAMGVFVFTSACLDDTPSATTELSGSAALMLRAVADLGAAAERDIGIRIYYRRGSSEIDLPAEPSRVRVTSGETRRQAVTVQLASCLADPERDGAPEAGCRLHVEIRLLDPSGATLDVQVSQPSAPSTPGQSVELSTIALSEVATVSIESVPALRVQESRTLTATALGANGQPIPGRTFTWASSDPGVVTVSPAGVLTAVAPGTATISATTGVRTGEVSVRVIPRVATVVVVPATPTMSVGATQQLTIVARDGAGTRLSDLADRTITWQSASPTVATVDATGRVTGVRAGTAEITATVDGVSGSTTISVISTPITITQPTGPVLVARTLALQTQGAVGTIQWSSSDATIASVDANGVVTGRFPGSATITATTSAGQTASVRVEARAASTFVSRATEESVSQGYSFALTDFVALDADGRPISGVVPRWSVEGGPMIVGESNGTWEASATTSGLGPATLVAREARTGAVLRTDSYNVMRPVGTFFTESQFPDHLEGTTDTLFVFVGDATEEPQAGRILQLSASSGVVTFPARFRVDSDGMAWIPLHFGTLPPNSPSQVTVTLFVAPEGDAFGVSSIPLTIYRSSAIVAPNP